MFQSSPSSLSDLKIISDSLEDKIDIEGVVQVKEADMVEAFKK